MLIQLLLFFFYTALYVDSLNETWDLDGPCQQHIQVTCICSTNILKNLAESQANMVKCASNYSSPPKVCTNCVEQYITFKQMEYTTHHLVCVSTVFSYSDLRTT